MDGWTLVVGGLVLLPVAGLIAVLADLVAAYNDLVRMQTWAPGGVESIQARHTLWAQAARALSLLLIAAMATSELLDMLHRTGIAVFVYAIALVLVVDAWRARRARRRMVALVNQQVMNGDGDQG